MKKIALCIGLNEYQYASKLRNTVNDANDMYKSLDKLGFSITLSINKDRINLIRDIYKFNDESKHANVSLVYFAGHGIQANGVNYLVPIDANPKSENELNIFCIKLEDLIDTNNTSNKVNIIILDSCRNNPFDRSWKRSYASIGLSPIIAPSGTLIAFSTSPGKTASDGNKKNGLYTEALLSEILKPDISILQLFQKVRQKVVFYSNNEQVPWESTSLIDDFYFNSTSYDFYDPRIIKIKKHLQDSANMSYLYERKELFIGNESTEGGCIYTNTYKNETKHIEKQLFYEMGRTFEDIYFHNNKVIFYRYTKHKYNVPCYISEESAREYNTDYFDEKKTQIIIKEFYICDNEVIGQNIIEDVIPTSNDKSSDIILKIDKIKKQSYLEVELE